MNFIGKYLNILNAYRDNLNRDIWILLMYRAKISPKLTELIELPRIYRHDAGFREVPLENSTQ